jgi:predicted enzyme related to lactoylglutathione lyase
MPDLNLTVPDYPYGAPCWVDLLVGDVERAQSFYSDLFGWRWLAGDAATGGYPMALLDGHPVAGISRKPAGAPVPSQWLTYLRVGQIEVAAAAIEAHGGRTLGRPVPIGALSRTVIALDPGGAYFGVWEPGDLPGSGLLDAPGSLTWNELLTRDYDRVQRFQLGVFGHEFTDETEPGGPRWATAHTGDGNPAYGLAEIGDEWPREIPPHWVASFAASDVVPAIGRALELGATLIQGPFDGPYGMGAVLSGPEGEVFSILVPDLD